MTWPVSLGQPFAIEDDGTGMTRDEFLSRWNHINYSRLKHQGSQVEFPEGKARSRRAYGSSGKGRHSVFCFADEYRVATWREGQLNAFRVERRKGTGQPWSIELVEGKERDGHGTRIEGCLTGGLMGADEIRRLLGSKFVADPEFGVNVNGTVVDFDELAPNARWVAVGVDGVGEVEIVKVASEPGRTSHPHGVAWWVNGRLVGTPGWETLAGHLLDGRKALAKSVTFIVRGDLFVPREDIAPDWSAFVPTQRTQAVHEAVAEHVRAHIRDELSGDRRERKKAVLTKYREPLRALSGASQDAVASFVDQIQLECPSLKDQDLENATDLLIKLAGSRSGYALLEKLAAVSVSDIDALDHILEEWSPADARRVLDELGWRLELIRQLEAKVNDRTSDELHHLQPLFERGLWIFGPEFESIEFRSNRALVTVLRELFRQEVVADARLRPDLVVLPNASLGAYARERFDDRGEVAGYAKVVIVELKRGDSTLGLEEVQQAQKYAVSIRDSGQVHRDTDIVCLILGSRLGGGADDGVLGTTIEYFPRTYNMVLEQAQARTFHLLEAIRARADIVEQDDVLAEVLAPPDQGVFPLREQA